MLPVVAVLILAAQSADPLSAGKTDLRFSAGDPDLRLEHFVLEIREPRPQIGPPGAASSAGLPRPVGSVCLRCRVVEGGVQLECDAVFRREGTAGLGPEAGRGAPTEEERVLHVEHLTSDGSRLVWREWGPGRARSLTAEWSPDGGILRTVEAGRGGGPREAIEAAEGAVMPLYLVELAREGRIASGKYRRFDPLARRLEEVEMRTSYRNDEEGPLRRVEMLRGDGSLAGRFEFRGIELWSFQWQESDLAARRVSAEEFEACAAASPAVRRP